MSFTTVLILISILIVLFSFIVGGYIYNKKKENESKQNVELEKFTQEKQRQQLEIFFKENVYDFFKKYKDEYSNIPSDTTVASLNDKYKKELTQLINSNEIRSIINHKESIYNEKALYLKVIVKESPFTWEKKFGDRIEEYYGER